MPKIKNKASISKVNVKLNKNLNLEDVFCIACRCIYLRPVSMPCGHTLCLECFKNMVNITAYQCPLCRMRISNWLRKYKHDWDSLVDEKLWEAVQHQYPEEVQKRINDEDDGIEERIVCQGFTRVLMNEGEIKKEFDDMRMQFLQEQEEIELQNVELAKRLQEEEEAIRQSVKVLNEELTKDDVKIASVIEEKIQEEYQQEQLLLNESDMNLAIQLQDQISQENKTRNNTESMNKLLSSSKKNPPKKGPLDLLFSKISPKTTEVQNTSNSLSSYSSSSSSRSLFQSPSTSSSGFHSDPCTSSSVTDSSAIILDDNLDACTCGRLQDFNSINPPCQFCVAQMCMLNRIMFEQRNDFLMAKNLEEQFKMENFDNYNLRKRSSPTQPVLRRKTRKLSKGQQTLKHVFLENNN